MIPAVNTQSPSYQLDPMGFIDKHPVFSIVLPIITTLGVYPLTGAPSLLILGMLASAAVVVIHFCLMRIRILLPKKQWI